MGYKKHCIGSEGAGYDDNTDTMDASHNNHRDQCVDKGISKKAEKNKASIPEYCNRCIPCSKKRAYEGSNYEGYKGIKTHKETEPLRVNIKGLQIIVIVKEDGKVTEDEKVDCV